MADRIEVDQRFLNRLCTLNRPFYLSISLQLIVLGLDKELVVPMSIRGPP